MTSIDSHEPDEPQEGRLWKNIAKVVFLVAVLAAFWYFFDKWLSGRQ